MEHSPRYHDTLTNLCFRGNYARKKMLGGPTSMRNGFGVRSDILMTRLQRCSVKKNTLNLICSKDYMKPSTLWQVTSCGINMDDTYLPPHSPPAFPQVWTGYYFFFSFLPPAITCVFSCSAEHPTGRLTN